MQDDTSTFDDDVESLLAEQERLEAELKKKVSLREPPGPVVAYKLKRDELKTPQNLREPSPVPADIKQPVVSAPQNEVNHKSQESPQNPVKKRKSAFSRRMLYVIVPLVGLAFVGFYLPSIIVAAGYGPEIVNAILKPYGMQATFDVVTLEWTKPIKLKNVKLTRLTPLQPAPQPQAEVPPQIPLTPTDSAVNPDFSRLMELEEFQTGKTLWEIVQTPKNPGVIALNKPKGLFVITVNNQQQVINNWAEIIQQFTHSKPEVKNQTGTPVELHIVDGEIEIKDLTRTQQMQISKLKVDLLNNLNDQREPTTGTGKCQMDFNLRVDQEEKAFAAQADWTKQAGNLALKTEQFPLSLIQPYLHQHQPGLQLAGTATSLVTLRWVNEPDFRLSQADFSVNAKQVAVTSTELTPRIVTIPELQLTCVPRLNDQPPTANEPATAATPSNQFPASWDITAKVLKPMLITPILDAQQRPTKNYAALWDDQQVSIVSNIEIQGLNPGNQLPEAVKGPATQLVVRSCQLNSQTANLDASGVISDILNLPVLDMQLLGVINSAKLFPVIDPGFAQQFQFEGLQLTSGKIQGPLWPSKVAKNPEVKEAPTLTANPAQINQIELAILDLPATTAQLTYLGDFKWQRANIVGIPLDQGVMNTYLVGDTLKLTPGGIKVMQGELKLQPTLQFVQGDILIHLPEGTILDRAQITREFSHAYLKYASPLFAEATAVNGEFSFAVPKSTYSLNQLRNPNLNKDIYQADLVFHQAKVGPGALFGEIAQLIESIRAVTGKQGVIAGLQQGATWVDMPAQTVKLQMTNGRVYHDQLQFQISNLPVVSTGSVGVQDQTLNMSLKLTMPDTDKKILKLIANQDIDLKLTGTMKQPRLDKGSLADLGKNFGAGAAFNLLDNLIERRREKQGK